MGEGHVGESGYKWRRDGVPHRGWTLVFVSDCGEPVHQCQMCRNPAVRYVHRMTHPRWIGSSTVDISTAQAYLDVGCVCAEKMAEDYTTSRELERGLRNRAKRLATFMEQRWRRSAAGGLYLKKAGRIFALKPVTEDTFKGSVGTPTGRKVWNGDYLNDELAWAWTDGAASFEDTLKEMFDYVWPPKTTVEKSKKGKR